MSQKIFTRAAAQAVGYSPHSLRKWVKQGLITANKTPGGLLYFDMDLLRRQLSIQAGKPEEAKEGK